MCAKESCGEAVPSIVAVRVASWNASLSRVSRGLYMGMRGDSQWSVSKPNPNPGGYPAPVTEVTVSDLPESTLTSYREFAGKKGSCTVGQTIIWLFERL